MVDRYAELQGDRYTEPQADRYAELQTAIEKKPWRHLTQHQQLLVFSSERIRQKYLKTSHTNHDNDIPSEAPKATWKRYQNR